MATNMVSKSKGFSGIKDAAQNSTAVPATAPAAAPVTPETPGPSAPAAEATATAPQASPDTQPNPAYDSQEGEDPDTGHAHLMHDLGTAIQEMMAKDPQTNKSMSDLMEEFMGKGIDYDAEGKRLRGLIEARKTPKAPNWVAAGVGSWVGGPEVASKFQALQEAAGKEDAKKQADIESTESNLLKEHVEDLRSRGKTKEALLMGLMSGAMAQKRTETQESGKNQREKDAAALRLELQDRALGSAEERVRMQVAGRKDVADHDRTVGQVMHLYESLLRQQEKDVTGASKPIYTANEAMDMAMNTILPKVKAGVETVKTGQTPPSTTPVVAPKSTPLTFLQWKAQQAATRK